MNNNSSPVFQRLKKANTELLPNWLLTLTAFTISSLTGSQPSIKITEIAELASVSHQAISSIKKVMVDKRILIDGLPPIPGPLSLTCLGDAGAIFKDGANSIRTGQPMGATMPSGIFSNPKNRRFLIQVDKKVKTAIELAVGDAELEKLAITLEEYGQDLERLAVETSRLGGSQSWVPTRTRTEHLGSLQRHRLFK